MSNQENLEHLLRQAIDLIETCKRLDYQEIIAHEPTAVAALQNAVRAIRGTLPGDNEALGDYADRQREREPAPVDKTAVLDRRRRFVEALSHAGLSERLGKIYCTESAQRLLAFREIPHKHGLPQFDMVVGPDYSPQSGYHGIFIGEQEVFSCLLPLPFETMQWQVRERHRFAEFDRMVDLVSMLSAGFPVH